MKIPYSLFSGVTPVSLVLIVCLLITLIACTNKASTPIYYSKEEMNEIMAGCATIEEAKTALGYPLYQTTIKRGNLVRWHYLLDPSGPMKDGVNGISIWVDGDGNIDKWERIIGTLTYL